MRHRLLSGDRERPLARRAEDVVDHVLSAVDCLDHPVEVLDHPVEVSGGAAERADFPVRQVERAERVPQAPALSASAKTARADLRRR